MNESSPVDQDAPAATDAAATTLRCLVVLVHFIIGLLLIGLSLWSQYFRVFLFPLIPCLGLGWMMAAAALHSGQPGLANVTRFWHVLHLVGAALLAALGLFMVWPSSPEHTPHAVGAVLAPAFGGVMLVVSGVGGGISIFSLLMIRRLPPRSGAERDRATRAALFLAVGAIAFTAAAAGAQQLF